MNPTICAQKSQYCYWAPTDGCKTREDKDIWNFQYDASVTAAGSTADVSAGVSTSGSSATFSSSITFGSGSSTNETTSSTASGSATVDTASGSATVDTSGAGLNGLLNIIGGMSGGTGVSGNIEGPVATGEVPECGNVGRWCQALMRCVYTTSDNFLEMCPSESDIGKELSCEDFAWDPAKCSAESEWCYWSTTDGCKDKETIGLLLLAKQQGNKSLQIQGTSRKILLLYFVVGTMTTFASFLFFKFCLSLRKSTTNSEDKSISLI